ncbi:TonB family protein [Mucilaginibacter sp. RS28]|uniref:TonB family protein n=1 Tax=Mucilaginibacter straminoryzae TaxID=2932774 RepID=A0A9X2BD89_9SPHI|nr:energy transducer TonB [Mucilaginibacter straminoryzae]MCJ8211847.1 TonB family protein [Mucilaginibacter straminoryzae]
MLIPKFDLYKAEWLDLVFQNRNKAYGAYELRKHHGNDTFKAISIVVGAFLAAGITVTIIAHQQKTDLTYKPDDTVVVNIKPVPKTIVEPPVQPPPAHKIQQSKSLAPVKTVAIPTHITTSPVETNPPTQIEIQTSAIGSKPLEGTGGVVNAPVTTTEQGTGTGIGEGTEQGNNEPLKYADVAPEPAGGIAGWTKFLQRNLRYPNTEEQGRVFLSFVVERDGSLTDIKVLKGVSAEIDAEAIRVLKIAPKWKPGMQSGKPVRVSFTIPIVFQITN